MTFAPGSLVRARSREWVVLPDSDDELLILRPLGGSEDEVTGIHTALEEVESAHFELPDPSQIGDYRSCRLLRDAVRLGFRAGAGPFRSFARIAVEPRPYQIVPLLMALKLSPVRLLIADDVGIGKTIEACLIAKELIDRGEAQKLAVLCPPQLAEQWQAELRDKFHIDAELVLSSTASRLERNCAVGQSLFEIYDYFIVSTDFIKSDRRRDEFFRACPDLVIVDEAHSCAYGAVGRGGRHQRYQLIRGLADSMERHMIFVTATPHSGNEEAFRSLLSFLDKRFGSLPEDITGRENEPVRRRLASYYIQRRRGDIRHYLEKETPFPEREEAEESYCLSDDYKKLFHKVLSYARERVIDKEGSRHRQRVRWWSALALLRSLASSPAAAAATLRSRAAVADTETVEEADQIGRETVLDLDFEEVPENLDNVPGSDVDERTGEETQNRRRLLAMAREADKLLGEKDEKLKKSVTFVNSFLKDGYHPILFCRFIPTAEYVAAHLRKKLAKDVEAIAVTGTLPPAERKERILQLAQSPKRVLVCTDCLSEGINLQEYFDAVMHYDLSWNPTRHEQRSGRVDRYGQSRPAVRVLTYYGIDNQIDGIVLDVLIRKHKKIKSFLGYSVPVPADTTQVIEAIFEGMLLREEAGTSEAYLPGFDEYFQPEKTKLFTQWDSATDREKRSRTMFAQVTIKVDEVAHELKLIQDAIGSGSNVAAFTKDVFKTHKAVINEKNDGTVLFDLKEVSRSLLDTLGLENNLKARFELPVESGTVYLHRTHPIVEGLANYIITTSLDKISESNTRRAGVIFTNQVERRTTLLLVRVRYHLISRRERQEKTMLSEDCKVVAFTGSPGNAEWIGQKEAEALLNAQPEANITHEQARDFVKRVVDDFDMLIPHLDNFAVQNGDNILEAHQRVRRAAQIKGVRYNIEAKLPPDILGIYIYLPKL